MSSGKSYLAQQIIENLEQISYSDIVFKETEVIFISKSNLSADKLSDICKKKSYKFSWWKLIHPLNNLFKEEHSSKHILIVMEDLSGDINSADSKFNSEMISFLF